MIPTLATAIAVFALCFIVPGLAWAVRGVDDV